MQRQSCIRPEGARTGPGSPVLLGPSGARRRHVRVPTARARHPAGPPVGPAPLAPAMLGAPNGGKGTRFRTIDSVCLTYRDERRRPSGRRGRRARWPSVDEARRVAAGMRPPAVSTGTVLTAGPADGQRAQGTPLPRPRAGEGRRRSGHSFFGYFLVAQESTSAADRRTKPVEFKPIDLQSGNQSPGGDLSACAGPHAGLRLYTGTMPEPASPGGRSSV